MSVPGDWDGCPDQATLEGLNVLYIRIDVYKRVHEVVILDQFAKPLSRSFKIRNTHDDIAYLLERIAKLNSADETLLFGMGYKTSEARLVRV